MPPHSADPPSRFATPPAARRWIAVLLALAAVFLIVGGVVAPLLLPRVDAGSVVGSVLAAARETVRDGVLILLAAAALAWGLPALGPERMRRLVPPATPGALGAVRMWIALILLGSVLWEDVASSAHLPREMLQPDRHLLIGFLVDLPIGFDRMLASAPALEAFSLVAALLLAAAAAGFRTRWTVPAAAVAYLVFAAIPRAYAWSYHTGVIPLYALLLLAFTPCGDGWSVDRLLRIRRGAPVPPADEARMRYGAGRYLVWMAVALPYTLAGLSKLRNTGLDWWRGEHMKQMLVATVVEPMHFDFTLTFQLLRGPEIVWDLLGIAALVGEVTFALVLVSVLARRILPLVMAGMHVGILLTQNILFPDLIAIQAVFYDWSPVRRRMADGWARVRGGARGIRPATPRPVPAAVDGDGGALRRQGVVMRVFLFLAVFMWATRTEAFPLTAMQMFSRPVALAPVEYVRPVAVRQDGTRERARFERWIGAMADARYRRIIGAWDADGSDPVLRAFLDAAARRANAEAAPGRRIVRFELERRRWDFRAHPADPSRGATLAVLVHDVDAVPEQAIRSRR